MANYVTFPTMVEKHPNRFILATVAFRDAIGRARGFKVLQTVRDTENLQKAISYYEAEGFTGVVAIPNFNEEQGRPPEFPPNIAAQTFRNLYHA